MHEVIWSDTALAQLDAIGIYLVPVTDMREIATNYLYMIRYRVARDGTVSILRVRHTARRPTNP